MSTDRDKDVPDSVTADAEALGVQKHPHGDTEEWLKHNLEDEERGPVTHEEPEPDAGHDVDPAEPRATGEDNLVQLPIGAEFGLDHEPTPQEREELLRFAAEADRELHRGDGQQDQDTGGVGG